MRLVAGLLISASLLLIGCSSKEELIALNKTFLHDVDPNSRIKNLPFDHSWARQDLERKHYDWIYLAPVRSDLIEADAWEANISVAIVSEEGYKEEVEELAQHFGKQLRKEIKKSFGKRIKFAKRPTKNTAIIETALTEVQFSHPIASAGALALPVPGAAALTSALSSPHVTFAMRISDGTDKKLIATIADRKYPPKRLLDFKKLSATASAREICDYWAEELAETFNKGRFFKVEEVGTWAFLPW
jgi:hypothetical protein